MAASLEPRDLEAGGSRRDAGDALIDLLGFVAQIRASTPAREPEPLAFPPLARVVLETRERQRG
jgi:hypothetical protein